MTFANSRIVALLLTALFLTACGGGSGTTANNDVTPTATCDPADPATFDECGTVLIGFTDDDGDFLNYTVNISKLTLETADGRVVEVLPRQTRINFTDYVDLTELVERTLDDLLGRRVIRDVVEVGHGRAARCDDLVDHPLRRRLIGR